MCSTESKKQNQGENRRRRVLMLVNWKVNYCMKTPEGIQPPDYFIAGEPYWFFRYMSPEWEVNVVDIAAPGVIAGLEKRLRFYVWQTLRILPEVGKYDLVLSHGMQSGIVLALWRRVFGKGSYKHIVFDIGAFNSGRENGTALKLMQFASKSLDGVIYHTKIQEAYYQRCHPWLVGKSQYIPFGTDASFFTPDIKTESQSAQISKEDTYILAFGKIKRDWGTLLRAYELSHRKLKLRIVGAAEQISSLDFKAKEKVSLENVQIYPYVLLDNLLEMIQEASFCIVPLSEFPYSYGQMTLLQQMSMKKAVIAADVSSLQAYHDGDGVLWYKSGNVEQLAEEIDLLTDDIELRQSIGQRAREAVLQLYNEQLMAGRIDQFLHERIG